MKKLIKSVLFNENLIGNHLLSLIRFDVNQLRKWLCFQKSEYIIEESFEDFSVTNKIPESWWKSGFLMDSDSLYDFFFILLNKLEYLNTLQNSMQVTPQPFVIDLTKLFDPFSFFVSVITDYSIKNQVI